MPRLHLQCLLALLCALACAGPCVGGAPHLAAAYARGFASLDESSPSAYNYSTLWFEQSLDHFNFAETRTFQQRYLVNLDSYGGEGCPIFFYTGNEGPAPLFLQNTGFIFEAAATFKAAVVVGEHRYYGDSLPFGAGTYNKTANLQWLTSEQALADYAVLLTALKDPSSPSYLAAGVSPKTAVVAFGGSYGGMLTAWARMKYPHVYAGGIAASAPIWQFTNLTGDETFSSIATRTFSKASPQCSAGVRAAWSAMDGMSLADLSSRFRLCSPLASRSDVQEYLYPWIAGALSYMAMADYPYPSSFLGPMPASPVAYSCRHFEAAGAGGDVVGALYGVVNVFYNYTGLAGACYNVKDDQPSTLGDQGGWNYQACTEMVMPVAQDSVHDMFYPMPWSLASYVANCVRTYDGTVPRPDWVATHYGGHNIGEYSNIVFSNGDLDPWSGGGVLANQSASLPAVYIEGGAHHLDLRASNPADPPSVVAARAFHRRSIAKWLEEWSASF